MVGGTNGGSSGVGVGVGGVIVIVIFVVGSYGCGVDLCSGGDGLIVTAVVICNGGVSGDDGLIVTVVFVVVWLIGCLGFMAYQPL